jgi:hypothetical protein
MRPVFNRLYDNEGFVLMSVRTCTPVASGFDGVQFAGPSRM